MEIVDVRTFVIGNPWKNWVLVKMETDEGIYGWGDATQGLATQPVVGAVHELRRFYIGQRAFVPEGFQCGLTCRETNLVECDDHLGAGVL